MNKNIVALNILFMLMLMLRGKLKNKNMFRNIVSRLSFSPALVGQLSFYAKRLQKEQFTRRLGLIFTALALVVQSLVVFQAPEPANAASHNDFVYGGVKTVDQLLALYDKNSGNLKDIFDGFGITRAEIAGLTRQAQLVTVGNKLSWGRHQRSHDTASKKVLNSNGTHVDTVYGRPMSKTYKRGAISKEFMFTGHSKKMGWFGIIPDCANLVTDTPPPPPPPPPADISVCRLSDNKVIKIKENQFDSKLYSKNLSVCNTLEVCRLSDFRMITIREKNFDSKLYSKVAAKDCVKPIEVCNLKTYKMITIKETDFDANLHSKNKTEDCKSWSVCRLSDFKMIDILKTDFDPNLHSNVPAEDCRAPEEGELELSKSAINTSQGGVDATKTVAKSNDRITYTISIKNTGETELEANFTDNITDILEYSELIDHGGGVFDNKENILSWPAVNMAGGSTEQRTYAVKVLQDIPATPVGTSDRTSYDCKMDNVFGNGVLIDVECPGPKIIETVEELPPTGPAENMTFAAIVFALVTYFYYRSKQLNKEVRLVRRNLNTGAL